jgi:hypothetical protein
VLMLNSPELTENEAPILFCHYGNSKYLNFTLSAAKLFNPTKRVILLGDHTNRDVASKARAEHYEFRDYDGSEDIAIFDKVYRHVAGTEFKNEFWTKFVFKRWFLVHAFLRRSAIRKFWHFDSDTLILADLRHREKSFDGYDCTEQCNGSCMNGLVTCFEVVDGYVKTINALFQDEQFLNEQRRDLEIHPAYAFTEMRAYEAYRKRSDIRTIRLNTIIDQESFDDCICQPHGFETYEKPLHGQHLKKVFYDGSGRLFCKTEAGEFIRMNSFNMSWVPDYLFELILQKANPSGHIEQPPCLIGDDLNLLDVHSIPLIWRQRTWLDRQKRRISAAAHRVGRVIGVRMNGN